MKRLGILNKLKQRAKDLEKQVFALYLAYKRKDTPLRAKIVALIIVGYALSPIDLIPDFIPVLGYLDDLILIPAGISLAIKLVPPEIMKECRKEAENSLKDAPKTKAAGFIIVLIWILILVFIVYKVIFK